MKRIRAPRSQQSILMMFHRNIYIYIVITLCRLECNDVSLAEDGWQSYLHWTALPGPVKAQAGRSSYIIYTPWQQ